MASKRKRKKGSTDDTGPDLFSGQPQPPMEPPPPDDVEGDNRPEFFDEASEPSRIKTRIVTRFFEAWCNVMSSTMRLRPEKDWYLGYADLFAGRGLYRDGTPSTPLIVIGQLLRNLELSYRMKMVFNDADPENCRVLGEQIAATPGIDRLRFPPEVWNQPVTDAISGLLEPLFSDSPTFYFIDPFGYLGLTHALIDYALQGWGNDCVFFFNYRRINMSLQNEQHAPEVDRLFGPRAQPLRERLRAISAGDPDGHARQRESIILEELALAMRGTGERPRYVLPFGFKTGAGKRTSHYLVFVSKHIRGHEIMKEVMAQESAEEDGVPIFCYTPAGSRDNPLLSGLHMPEDELASDLQQMFAGRAPLTVEEVYEAREMYSPTRFLKNHYKTALLKLEARGHLSAAKPNRKQGTMADDVVVTFHSRSKP